jgi:hypothetical protein
VMPPTFSIRFKLFRQPIFSHAVTIMFNRWFYELGLCRCTDPLPCHKTIHRARIPE